MKPLISLLAFLLAAGFAGPSDAQASERTADPADDIVSALDEWNVPFDESWSRDPYVGPDGLIYFVGQWTDYVAWFDPETEEFGHIELEEGANPHSVVVSDDGTAWYAALGGDHIGEIDLDTGEITQHAVDQRLSAPHTIRFAADGNFWFTGISGDGIGHFDVETHEITTIALEAENASPYGLVMDPSGTRPWAALFGTNKIATVDPETMEVEEIELPRADSRARRLNITSDGMVWIGDYAEGYIVRYDPVEETFAEWEIPYGSDSGPYAVMVDDQDRLWFSASGLSPNRLVAFDTRSEEFVTSAELETDRGVIRNVDYDASNGTIWFGTDMGHIGRVMIQ